MKTASNRELEIFSNQPNTVEVMESTSLEWADHMVRKKEEWPDQQDACNKWSQTAENVRE